MKKQRRAAPLPSPIAPASAALPTAFIQSLQGQEELLYAIEHTEPCVSIRLNPVKWTAKIPSEVDGGRVAWCAEGYYRAEPYPFTFDPLFHAGAYYVQEASSMFLAHALRALPMQPLTALDLCAAPGGKSTLLRSLLPEGSLLVSNEVMPARASVLVENMQKWGHPDVVVTSGKPHEFGRLRETFDVLLADVPCSGEGMFRKDPAAIREWSVENVARSARRQREIVQAAWPALKTGGTMIYSTCTYNTAENEENILWICRELGAELVSLSVPAEWGITGSLSADAPSLPVYRFLPHKTRGEGLFMAVLRKTGKASAERQPTLTSSKKPLCPSPKGSMEWLEKLQHSAAYEVMTLPDEALFALKREYFPLVRMLQTTGIKLLSVGIPLAIGRGHDFIPQTALALSTALRDETFPRVSLNYSQAITFLQRNNLVLPADTPKGFVVVAYQDLPLGFVKNLGSRANNPYPAEWRIRSTHTPNLIPNLF
jgi:16S rRNA C967 or C1407 C5-methylase (RsmB/RsmF family)/NOL1/NOP2/fmu family ribosome biogenesis protein